MTTIEQRLGEAAVLPRAEGYDGWMWSRRLRVMKNWVEFGNMWSQSERKYAFKQHTRKILDTCGRVTPLTLPIIK